MLLPYLGGTPAVWNTCMLFFQTLLLAGYAYAHLATTRLPVRPQIILHLLLLVAAALCFPVQVSEEAVRALDGAAQPLVWLLARLSAMVGLPFLLLATGGPLLQKWFSYTAHPAAKDPYFLYGASNFGSFLALFGYPLLLEPGLRLREQSLLWAAGYGLLLVLLGACAVVRWCAAGSTQPTAKQPTEIPAPLTVARRLRWVALAFVPSTLMLGVTTYLSTDISPIPLLWVMPLGLYLLTFILAFARRQYVSLPVLSKLVLGLGLALIFLIVAQLRQPIILLVCLHLLFFFIAALVGHTRLAEDRPPAAQLTEFYLWLSLGGMLGGVFNNLLAPHIFDTIAEYPLAVILALMLRVPSAKPQAWATPRWFDLAWPLGAGATAALLTMILPRLGMIPLRVIVLSCLPPALIAAASVAFPLRFALTIGALLLGANAYLSEISLGRTLLMERNFFGTLRVAEDREGKFRLLYHGNTIHGRQFRAGPQQCEPLSYYHQRSPLGQAMTAFAAAPAAMKIAVVGLGTGAIATYSQPGQQWTYYEIDPAVLAVATRSEYFTYLSQCAATPVKTILGDARLQLRHAPDGQYDLLVLDAFSSDAVPTHLLTRQALQLYLTKLAPGGRLLFHVSNHYLDLRSVVAALTQSEGLVCLASDDTKAQKAALVEGQDPAYWMAVARTESDLGALSHSPHWHRAQANAQSRLWLDDYSNVLGAFKWK
jgi:SAM-dependent methyltransferase